MRRASETVLAMMLHLLLATVCLASDTWNQLNVQCLPEGGSLSQFEASSEIHCTVLASSLSDVGTIVAQFNQVSRLCSLFLFQPVCRQMVAGQSVDCRVFIRSPVNPQSINAKLNGLWLGDSASRFDNLMCQVDADTNRFYPVGNVQWTGYGAKFDGQSAYLVMRKGNLDFIGGLTWLLRLKRQPRNQALLEFVDCNNINGTYHIYTDFWENTLPGGLYVCLTHMSTINSYAYHTPIFMTLNSEDWIDIAFTAPPNASISGYNFYYNGDFISKTGVLPNVEPTGAVFSRICAYFGWRFGNAYNRFDGTLRAIGMANTSMSEDEIRDFFATVK